MLQTKINSLNLHQMGNIKPTFMAVVLIVCINRA
jgi:hypothetical protein